MPAIQRRRLQPIHRTIAAKIVGYLLGVHDVPTPTMYNKQRRAMPALAERDQYRRPAGGRSKRTKGMRLPRDRWRPHHRRRRQIIAERNGDPRKDHEGLKRCSAQIVEIVIDSERWNIQDV